MLARVVRTVSEVVDPVVVVAAESQDVPQLPVPVTIARDEQEGLGPLGGLAAGLAALRPVAEAAFVSSCDAPLLKPAFIQHLTELIGDHELVILRDGKYYHPLAAVYRTALEDRVRELIAAERLRPFFLVEACDSRIVDVEEMRGVDPNLDSLRNTNTPEEYAAPLEEAAGRILAADVQSAIDVPSFNRSAMDGYAVRGAETDGAGDYNPLPFRVVGEARPGKPFAGVVDSGSVVRVMTGAPLPEGADAVVPAEYAEQNDDTVTFTTSVPPRKHVGYRGEDVSAGDVLMKAGRRLRPQDLGLLASIGVPEVGVVVRPRVRILVTGNELVRPGEPRSESQIFEANSYILRVLCARDGGVLESVRQVTDDRDAIRRAMTEPGADVVLVSGGSSVGAEDFAPAILAEEGELGVHGIAMRPSSPTGIGCIGRSPVFLLPGNPVSCLCAYDFFAGRAIRLLGGRSPDWPYRSAEIELARKISSAVGRLDYCRVGMTDGKLEPLALSGASILSSTTRADGFVIVPEASEALVLRLFMPELAVELKRLKLANPILVASGTFGYARELAAYVPLEKLGGIVPKTITSEPRIGNPPPRTVETASGMLNSIGLDNDGLEAFIEKHLPYFSELPTAVIVNIAGKTIEQFETMAARLSGFQSIAGLELNISCPNVSGGVDFGINPESAAEVVRRVCSACDFPVIAKLTPNITSVVPIAQAAVDAGADAVSLINTVQGIAVDWRKRKPVLGACFGGLSGPAIKPIALRIVRQVAQAVDVPIIGIGGIQSIDDVMEFLVTGATAVQIGTANFYNPGLAGRLVDELDRTLAEEKCQSYIALQNNEQAFYFIANLHALNTVRDPDLFREYQHDAAVDLLALGLDPEQAVLFRQSDVPEIPELTWLLLTLTQMSLLDKCVSYKDKKAKGLAADAGLFVYPVLQAADIVGYDSDIVPVGVDQVQHIEVTRDIAQRFNSTYNSEVFVLPKAHVVEETAKVPGLDGEKMSKSYNNHIEVFMPEKKLRKKIMSIKTDSTPVEDPKDPEACNVFTLYKLFADESQQAELAGRYRAGGMGYGEAKQTLFEAAMEYFADARVRRAELEAHPDRVEDILRTGAAKARLKAAEVLDRARAACGIPARA
eukprot:g33040.t1